MTTMSHLKKYFLWLTCSAICVNALPSENSCDNGNTTVRMVHVLFRHGDRANDASTVYPNDPHINQTYEPYGINQLTNEGKQREFMIGEYLYENYYSLLQGLCKVNEIEAISTDVTRTKMSALLVLAGLCPPIQTPFEWNKRLNWQPIPYDSAPFDQNKVITLPIFYCPNYIKLYNNYVNSPFGKQVQEKYKDLFQYLTKHTGMVVNSTMDVFLIYFGLYAEAQFGLILPEWTLRVFPKYMEKAVIDQYIMLSGTTDLKRFSGGFLLKKIIDDMQAYIYKKAAKKMYLYSGHELNVAYLLNTLEVYFPHVPPYGAYVLVELHEKGPMYCVKIYYQDYSGLEPKILKIPGCQCCCPFKQFVRQLSKNIPRENDNCGDDPSVLHQHARNRGLYS